MRRHYRIIMPVLTILIGCQSPRSAQDTAPAQPKSVPAQADMAPAQPESVPAAQVLVSVPVCQGLTLYGNAAASGLCKTLSPGTQNLWVCGLTTADPDVHTTFNAGTALHVTVRTPPGVPTCEGNSTLTGTWQNPPNAHALAIGGGQPTTVCNVGIQDWVTRLNAVPSKTGGGTFCQAGFLAAQEAQKFPVALIATYLTLCTQNNCP